MLLRVYSTMRSRNQLESADSLWRGTGTLSNLIHDLSSHVAGDNRMIFFSIFSILPVFPTVQAPNERNTLIILWQPENSSTFCYPYIAYITSGYFLSRLRWLRSCTLHISLTQIVAIKTGEGKARGRADAWSGME